MNAYLGSDNLLRLLGLTDQKTGNFVTNATVVATILSADGLTTIAGPITLSYTTGSVVGSDGNTYKDGNYLGALLAANLNMTADTPYQLDIVATTPTGARREIRVPLVAQFA